MTVGFNWLKGSPVNYNRKCVDVSMEKGEVKCIMASITEEEWNAAF